MKKRALLYITIAPFIYLYGLAENHFSFGKRIRSYTLDFIYEYINAWRMLFGKDYIDNSIKVSEYEYKLKAKSAKVDLEIAFLMKELYGSWKIKFNKKKRSIEHYYSSEYSDRNLIIYQLDKDRFKIEYYNSDSWRKARHLETDYIFDKNQTIEMIKFLKERD